MFIETTATKMVFGLKKRIRFVNGGSSSSKTISILLWLIDYAQSHRNEIISVVSESMPHLKKGALRDFINIMQAHGYYKEENHNMTDSTYTFETGTKMEFFGADQSSKVRGPRRDVLFVNEANNIDYSVFVQLEIRTRKIVWVDSNPTHEYWMYTEIMPNNDIDFITLTYLQNEALEPAIVQSLESKKGNANFWRVYGLGQLGQAEGRIYAEWNLIDDIPHEAKLERYGLDFGYSNDPSALIGIYKYNGGLILDEVLYQKGMSNKQLADALLNLERALVIADSAEPKSIDELRSYGLTVLPSKKGPGSVLQGIQFVQEQKISVTKRSLNLLKEYRNYLWMTDKDGKIINEPEHEYSHSMDALRYAIASFRPNQENIAKQTQFQGGMAYRRGSLKASSLGQAGGASLPVLH